MCVTREEINFPDALKYYIAGFQTNRITLITQIVKNEVEYHEEE